MTANTLTLPLVTDFMGRLEKRLSADFEASVEEWSEGAAALTQWEDEHLLEEPSPEILQRHKATTERLLRFGKLLLVTTEHPDFPNPRLSATVKSIIQMLKDKLAMWHGKISEERREEILRAAFHES